MGRFVIFGAILTGMLDGGRGEASGMRLELREGWAIQSSARVKEGGEAVSRPGFATAGWHRATVPTTVVAALVADGTFPDPHYGMNLRTFPGVSYKVGTNFSNVEMPADSPFAVPWWYRTELDLPQEAAGKTLWLRLDGVNFRFDAWLNGKKIADAAQTAGAFRVHELDVTGVAKPGRERPRRPRLRPEAGRPRDHLRGLEPHAARQGDGPLPPGHPHRHRPRGAAPPAGRDEAEPAGQRSRGADRQGRARGTRARRRSPARSWAAPPASPSRRTWRSRPGRSARSP